MHSARSSSLFPSPFRFLLKAIFFRKIPSIYALIRVFGSNMLLNWEHQCLVKYKQILLIEQEVISLLYLFHKLLSLNHKLSCSFFSWLVHSFICSSKLTSWASFRFQYDEKLLKLQRERNNAKAQAGQSFNANTDIFRKVTLDAIKHLPPSKD